MTQEVDISTLQACDKETVLGISCICTELDQRLPNSAEKK